MSARRRLRRRKADPFAVCTACAVLLVTCLILLATVLWHPDGVQGTAAFGVVMGLVMLVATLFGANPWETRAERRQRLAAEEAEAVEAEAQTPTDAERWTRATTRWDAGDPTASPCCTPDEEEDDPRADGDGTGPPR